MADVSQGGPGIQVDSTSEVFLQSELSNPTS